VHNAHANKVGKGFNLVAGGGGGAGASATNTTGNGSQGAGNGGSGGVQSGSQGRSQQITCGGNCGRRRTTDTCFRCRTCGTQLRGMNNMLQWCGQFFACCQHGCHTAICNPRIETTPETRRRGGGGGGGAGGGNGGNGNSHVVHKTHLKRS